MAKSNVWENELLLLLFNNDDAQGIGDAGGLRGSVADGNVYIGLHTADPGEGGTQATNEATYTGYARVPQARTAAAWSVVANVVTNLLQVLFGECTAGSESITHFSIGKDLTGAGDLLYSAPVDNPLAVSVGVIPRFEPGDLEVTED